MTSTESLLYNSLIANLELQQMSFHPLESHTDFSSMDRLVASGFPGLFRGMGPDILGGRVTTNSVLMPLHRQTVPISVTPAGNADSPLGDLFVKPYTIREKVEWLLNRLKSRDSSMPHYYFQSQDNNLNSLYDSGCPLPVSLPKFCALLGKPVAANLWIGTSGTTSRLHCDNFDNVYVQIGGRKRIILIPPGNCYAVHEKFLTPATYDENLMPVIEDGPKVLFPTVNPSDSTTAVAELRSRTTIYSIDLEAGDVLFLPALWYHQVEILTPGINVSANYWHSPFNSDIRWAEHDLLRRVCLIQRGYTDDPDFFYDI